MDKGQILLYQTPDGESKIEVKLKDDTVWLSLDQMAELFQRNKSTISRHIKNVFEEGELDENMVVAKFATTTKHGAIEGKTQEHLVSYYNLDMIISVGYRVHSYRGVQFRIWATKVLKEYIVKGFLREVGIESLRELLIQYALMFYNAPYRWGGRTPNGVDGAGLVQMVYRLAGIAIPRYIDQQAGAGQVLSFLEEAQPGDLAFFGDSSGAVTHVGILWEQGRIIHASGKVRVDKIDHHGIFNEDLKRYTHTLKVVRQIF